MKYKGFIALSSILIISVVIAGIIIAGTFISISNGQGSLSHYSADSTLSFVSGCAEDVLEKLRESSSYAGGTITEPEGTCTVNLSQNNNVYTLTVFNTSGNFIRTLNIVVTRSATLTITSWQEI